ncbi:hypothetical protein [Pseudidiomarina terrestris]|uniref:YfcL family protein n=1 Tax=Pseudidiomarina terrestris TaxID=2820060 RepID=A0AAW7QXG5_9GAMM|nr:MULTISPECIES: hypothetical protein [unclassified Pseudidiomarina]MDN7124152.1 hypothetical protein [Pseudidiomarina sp. 1APP75-32.1]MDN7127219.1 hypothetical protein [Pseudidiomarina sp. 1APR75-33.1]MDN7128409.1 hypothetical protein [Pseudidiomarina sp. 1APR75-15]MDN7135343.1 hypothetical protein [Pseudidiomarina sp. 1ASP75-5]MDN7138607.1 hypothetical protein [Pseudidiomarina sp. 1ASP75-14]
MKTAYTDIELEQLLERLNKALFESDPMNTGCQENDAYDEYEGIAAAAVNYMIRGATERDAITQALKDSFDDLVTDEKVDQVLNSPVMKD